MRISCAVAFALLSQFPAPAVDVSKRANPDSVATYRDAASRLIGAALSTDAAWQRLAYLGDTFGNRLSGSPNLTELIFRLPAVLFLTGGIAFAAGLLEIRYLIGIVWLLSRLLFVTTPAALHAVATLSKGGEMPSPATLLIMILAAPETLLESRMPIVYSVGSSLAGAAALVISFLWFAKADFGGKRS